MTVTDRQIESGRAGSEPGGSGSGEPVEFAELWRPTDTASGPRGPERVLLDRGLISPDQLDKAVHQQRENPRFSVLRTLVQMRAIDDLAALQAVAAYFQLPFERVGAGDVDTGTFALLPVRYIKEKQICPIRREGDAVVVGLTDPADIFVIDDMKRRIHRKVQLVVVPPADIAGVVEELSSSPAKQVDEIIKDITEDAVEVVDDKKSEEVPDLERSAGESPVIRYVNYLIASAMKEGASDIHIEPGEKLMRVRCRVDGILFEQQAPPPQMHAAIVSRLKIMANLDIAERRLPQDGRIHAAVHGKAVDLRVSTLPITNGEKCVIRILDNRSIMIGLENLGMSANMLKTYRRQILQPHGIVLVTGPTGSGKSTTLYSSLRIMDGDELNISTVEDPVEYELPVANQVNVREGIGLTFAGALRSLLRQDPDIIMIGEIRDTETARIAVQASLTGHLVLSTLHTNDAPSSVTRLINIGIEPYLISASVNAVLAQRLVRRICEHCKAPLKDIPPAAAAYLERRGGSVDRAFRGAGCDKCRQTGYKGRIGVYEFMELDDELRDMITGSPLLTDLRRLARQKGMRGLLDDGTQKVAAGVTTIDEIMRVTET